MCPTPSSSLPYLAPGVTCPSPSPYVVFPSRSHACTGVEQSGFGANTFSRRCVRQADLRERARVREILCRIPGSSRDTGRSGREMGIGGPTGSCGIRIASLYTRQDRPASGRADYDRRRNTGSGDRWGCFWIGSSSDRECEWHIVGIISSTQSWWISGIIGWFVKVGSNLYRSSLLVCRVDRNASAGAVREGIRRINPIVRIRRIGIAECDDRYGCRLRSFERERILLLIILFVISLSFIRLVFFWVEFLFREFTYSRC